MRRTTTEVISALYHIYAKVKDSEKLEYSLNQFIKTLIQLVLFIRHKKIDNELSKEYEVKIIGRLKKENKSSFREVMAEFRSDLSDLDPLDKDKIIFGDLFDEIEKDP